MMTIPRIVLLGAGGMAREIAGWLGEHEFIISAFYDETQPCGSIFSRPVVRSLARYRGARFVPAVADPLAREHLWAAAVMAGLEPHPPILHHAATVARDCEIGPGGVVCPQAVISTGLRAKEGLLVGPGAVLAHGVAIGRFASILHGAVIGRDVSIRDGASIGQRAVLKDLVVIDRGVVVERGEVVLEDRQTNKDGKPSKGD